jgi:hypothetical protein
VNNNSFNHNLIKYVKIFLIVIISLFTIQYSLFFVKAHKFHTTLTRIDYNEKEKIAEIYVQVSSGDLLFTLERAQGKQLNLEKTNSIDEIIFNYLRDNFVLKDSNGKVRDLVWVGKEIENDSVFVYFQIENLTTIENFQLKNSLFFEHFPEQSNLVVCKFGNKKADLHFKAGDSFKEIITNYAKK